MSSSITIPSSSAILDTPVQQQQQQQQQEQKKEQQPGPQPRQQQKQGQQEQPITSNSSATKQRKRSDRRKSSDPAEPSHKQGPNVKPKQTKSRNGCITCKQKRLKCDEKKPACDQCAKRNVTCGGYKKDFKWRPFEEQTLSQVTKQSSAPKPKSDSDAPSAPRKSSGDSIDVPFPSSGHPETIDASSKRTRKSPPVHPAQECSTGNDQPSASPVASYPTSESYQDLTDSSNTSPAINSSAESFDVFQGGFFTNEPFNIPIHPYSSSANIPYFYRSSREDLSSHEYAISEAQLSEPNLMQPYGDLAYYQMWASAPASFLASSTTLSEHFGSRGSQSQSFHPQPSSTGQPMVPLPHQPPYDEGAEENVEEIHRTQDSFPGNGVAFPDSNFFAVQNWDPSLWTDPLQTMFQEPQFASNSVEMMVSRFDRRTCGIMSIKDGPTENPWRTLVLPLMHSNRIIFNAVMAMACLHSCKQEPMLFEQGKGHFETALKELQLVGQTPVPVDLDVAFAAMLALAFGESWGWTTSSGIDYIKKGKQLMFGAIKQFRQSPRDLDHLQRLQFLCRTWIYIDVIARLTSVDNDDTCDFESIGAMMANPLETKMDPLMGCACTLFPIIGRVANLVRQVCKIIDNSPVIIAQGSNLKLELEAWRPPFIQEIPEDESLNLAHSLQTAEAYRWATLLYLHQAIPEIASHSSAALAQQAMNCLSTVPLSSRVVIVQIYPLLAAGCEANTLGDRQWVQDRWSSMQARMAIGNVDRCAEVVREVWRRRDDFATTNCKVSPKPPSMMPVFDISAVEALPPWDESVLRDGRRATFDILRQPKVQQSQESRRASADYNPKTGAMLPEFTVRGSLHWVGVMKDWKWEVLLG